MSYGLVVLATVSLLSSKDCADDYRFGYFLIAGLFGIASVIAAVNGF